MKSYLTWPILWYLRLLAKIALSLNHPEVTIGIAGSVGKSSTRNVLKALFEDLGKTVTVGNSETGIPLGILGITPLGFTPLHWALALLKAPFGLFFLQDTRFLIVEMGIDDPFPPKNMGYLLTIIKPDISLLVNESAAHTEQFEKILTESELKKSEKEITDILTRAIANEDMKIASQDNCKMIIYNADNSFITDALKIVKIYEKTNLFPVGKEKINTISYGKYSVSKIGTTMEFVTKKGVITFTSKLLLPKEYREVIGLSICTLLNTPGIDSSVKDIKLHIESMLTTNFSLPKSRGSVFKGKKGSLVVDSSYNASKSSVLAYLNMLSDLREENGQPLVMVFGDMRELGKESKLEHVDVAEKIAEICDYVYLVGPLTKEYILPVLLKKSLKEVKWFNSNIEVGEYLITSLPESSIVLVKGSQNTIFLEETVKFLLLDKSGNDFLCRQDPYWLKVKKSQGKFKV